MISLEPALVAGKRIYTIVFSSNAPDPGNFDGTGSAALDADCNQEVWIYQLPEVDDTFDLSSGDDILPSVSLTTGAFRQITSSTPSRPPRLGVFPPDIIDDNRDATISDDGTTLAFISTRDLLPQVAPAVGNADFNPELFFCRTTGDPRMGGLFAPGTNTFAQVTKTANVVTATKTFPAIQQNPSLSANGNVVSFISTANLATPGTNNDLGNDLGNAEVYVADFSGTGLTNVRQVTKTKQEPAGDPNAGVTVNVLSAGRRLSRDGVYVAYESRAEDPLANNTTNAPFLAMFVCTVSDAALPTKIVGQRALAGVGDVLHFPTFSDYDGSLVPHSLVFASALNFKTDGTFPAAGQESTGLNPVPPGSPAFSVNPNQIFTTQLPITATNTFARLTKNPALTFQVFIAPLPSNTLKRIAFTLQSNELGGGNAPPLGGDPPPFDGTPEVYYLLTPDVTTASSAALSFFTGASNMGPFASADPSASPSPTPTPTPSPGDPQGLAPGELSTVRSTVGLATSDKSSGTESGPEATHSPILPIELNGVSVSVAGAAAGLYFVGDSPAEGISFVMPVGLAPGVKSVVINNQGTVFRGFVQIVNSQPDIFSTDGTGVTAMICNVTNAVAPGPGCIGGPFRVTTDDGTGTQVPTRLEIWVTGVRFIVPAETKVSFVSGTTTTDITPFSVRPNTNKFGFDLISITLPASVAGAAPIDYKVIVTVTKGGTFTSRPAATAPLVTINP